MTKIFKKYFISGLLAVMAIFTGCVDSSIYTPVFIPDGEGVVEVEANFTSFTPSLTSRAAGDAIQAIDQLTVFIYNIDGTPFKLNGAFPIVINNFTSIDKVANSERDYRVTFKLTVPNGEYRMYALANMDYEIKLKPGEEYLTERMLLESATPEWDMKDASKNNQMFGRFGSSAEQTDESLALAPSVVVKGSTNLHVWLKRCASKVTFQYDGSGLYPGVSIYLMSATIKDIPATCALGVDNQVTYDGALIPQGEILDYYEPNTSPTLSQFSNPNTGIVITKNPMPGNDHLREVWPPEGEAHSKTAQALFFYENMQGIHPDLDKRQQLADNGKDLIYTLKDDVPYGTYIEVEGIYYANIPEEYLSPKYESSGIIKYRFMLGQDVINDFNAKRNCHYKLTLKFKGKGNDVDWHIEYADPTLDVTQPKIFDYRGWVFQPKPSSVVPNRGHQFTTDNTVTVTSYMTDGMDKLHDFVIEYKPDGATTFSENARPDWLLVDVNPSATGNPYDRDVTFRINPEKIVCENFKIADLFNTLPAGNSIDRPFNLANPSEGSVDPKTASIQNSANSYMIDAPGYYIIPLVYGNSYVNGSPNKQAYNPGLTTDGNLEYFLDYKGNQIKSPEIKKSGTPKNAFLVWEDKPNLIEYRLWSWPNVTAWNLPPEIVYIPDAYKGIGGIKFHVSSVQEGNAVIAITDENITEANYLKTSLPRAMWSWHIWVTSFTKYKDYKNKTFDKGIRVSDHTIRVEGSDRSKEFNLMPVNLGWCSEGEEIKYYPERKCEVRFKSGTELVPLTKEITIIQKSHIAVPRGHNPYYQWGRKDPFWGVKDNSIDISGLEHWQYSRTIWFADDGYAVENSSPDRLTKDIVSDPATETVDNLADKRLTTKAAFTTLIQKPYVWHNPPRTGSIATGGNYKSNDQTYFNLWDGLNQGDWATPAKTIYDPCPVGYQVPNYKAFSGFAYDGLDASDSDYWFDVREEHVLDYSTSSKSWVNNDVYTDQVFEFYTTQDKYQSIVFPQNGYRDWDAWAYIYKVGHDQSIGYVWSANLVGGNDPNKAYNLEVTRLDKTTLGQTAEGKPLDQSFVRPQNPYYPCDGFSIRPCKQP